MNHELSILLTSAGDKETAEFLARGLIKAKLAACVQISAKGWSYYQWQGKLQCEKEYYLHIKTCKFKLEAATNWLKKNHPYEVAEIICLAATAEQAYADWVKSELTPIHE
ncbi:MAG: divalent-cation tolerance protein CutA [Mariprofundaceae bacterium]